MTITKNFDNFPQNTTHKHNARTRTGEIKKRSGITVILKLLV